MKTRDMMILMAEADGGVCRYCGCWILKGDVLLVHPETATKVHRGCCEALSKPPSRFSIPADSLFNPE